MTRLYRRRIAVTVGSRLFSEHEMRFDASLSLAPDPDNATIHLYNLSDRDRAAIETGDSDTQVALRAGYDDDPPAIFLGRWRSAETAREGPDIVTTVEAASALRAREYGRQLNRTYRAGTRMSTVVRDLLRTLDVGEGSLRQTLDQFALTGVGSEIKAPISVSGPAWDSLVEILESNGLQVTTEGDDLIAVGVDNALDRTAILLSAETGLRGVPSVDKSGEVSVQSAMIPGLIPGRLVRIQSEFLEAQFRVDTVRYVGSLYGQEFGATIEGRILS